MDSDVGDDVAYVRGIEADRLEKDEFFKTHPHSPIPWPIRGRIAGLAYFPVDPKHRVRAKLVRYPTAEPVVLATSKGVPRNMEKYGTFEFSLAGRALRLQVYRSRDQQASLFVPFRDATSGRGSYGAARYLDLEEHPGEAYVLDFNLAYNPYCAYSDDYVCPLPPRDNWLDVPVRAGEKDFPHAPGSSDVDEVHR